MSLKANTLLESLSSAYLNNSKLNAERASMRASREEKREALVSFCLALQFQAIQFSDKIIIRTSSDDVNFRTFQKKDHLSIEQKIFQGFGGVANFTKKKKRSKIRQNLNLKKLNKKFY